MCDEYNGWTNYETWDVRLWLNNDQGLYISARQTESSEELKEFVKEFIFGESGDTISNGMAKDLLTHALQKVDWNEVWDDVHSN